MGKRRALVVWVIQVLLVLSAAFFVALGLNAWLYSNFFSEGYETRALSEAKEPKAGSDEEQSVLAYNRNLFNQSSEAQVELVGDVLVEDEEVLEVESPVGGEALVKSELSLELLGTMVAGEPRWSVAHLRSTVGGEDFYAHVGDDLGGGRLVRIARTYVLLRGSDAEAGLEYIALAGSTPIEVSRQIETNSSAARSAKQVREMGSSSVLRVPAGQIREEGGEVFVDRELVQRQADSYHKLADDLKIQPMASGGELQGFRLGEVPEGTLFSGSGLRAGDVIVGVNGARPRDEESAMRFVEDLARKGEVMVEVDRRGQRKQIRLRAE